MTAAAVGSVSAPAAARPPLLEALARGPAAVVPVGSLPELWNLAPDVAANELDALLDAGVVEL